LGSYDIIQCGLQLENITSEFTAEKIGSSLAQTIKSLENVSLSQVLSLLMKWQSDAFVEIALEVCSSLENLSSPLYIIKLADKQGIMKLLNSYEIWSSGSNEKEKQRKKVLKEFVEYGLQYLYPVKTIVLEEIYAQNTIKDLLQCLKKFKQQQQYFSNIETLRYIVNLCGEEYFFNEKEDNLSQVLECIRMVCENSGQELELELEEEEEVEGCLGHCVYLIALFVEKSYINNRVHPKLLPLLQQFMSIKIISSEDCEVWRNDIDSNSQAKKDALILLADWLYEIEPQDNNQTSFEEPKDEEQHQKTKKNSKSKKNKNESDNDNDGNDDDNDNNDNNNNNNNDHGNDNDNGNEEEKELDSGGYNQLDLLQENPNVKTK